MTSYLVWPALTLIAWGLMYLLFIRPMLAQIHRTMGLDGSAPRLTVAQRTLRYFEGSKTVITSFIVSMFAIVKACLDALSANTSVLDELKNNVPWSTLLTPDIALKIVGAIMFAVTFLHLYGVLRAAKTPPQA